MAIGKKAMRRERLAMSEEGVWGMGTGVWEFVKKVFCRGFVVNADLRSLCCVVENLIYLDLSTTRISLGSLTLKEQSRMSVLLSH